MSNNHTIGKFCSVAKKDTIIFPKNIPGYISPEGQLLERDGQEFNFIYTPIKYNISYILNGGILDKEYKKYYTIEDEEYIPGNPVKENHTFIGWEPKKIDAGSIGDVIFNASWKPNAILLPGNELNDTIDRFVGRQNVMAIQQGNKIPVNNYINISSTTTKIYASFDSGILYIYSDSDIYCNDDMSDAFNGFTLLRDINYFYDFICKENTNITNLFKDCSLLSDVSSINDWANGGKFRDFTGAFDGTPALEAGRVPSWYRWMVKFNYKSSTGLLLESVEESKIPGEIVYAKSINGYKIITKNVKILSPDVEYVFEYEPIEYSINYDLDGGEILYPKISYTIEDETYYPPDPIKYGCKFISWNPECIYNGEYGNTLFVATYNNIE